MRRRTTQLAIHNCCRRRAWTDRTRVEDNAAIHASSLSPSFARPPSCRPQVPEDLLEVAIATDIFMQ
jgi:hypothetical protein